MPPKLSRPPKKGSKKDLEAKAAKASAKEKSAGGDGDELETVFKGLSTSGAEEQKATPEEDEGRIATGTLISEQRARDIKINAFSLSLHGAVLVEDTVIELNHGSRYGLIGRNGCGKSTFLKCLATREVPIPSHFDVYLLAHEASPGEDTALEYVINSAVAEVARLDAMIEQILTDEGPESELLSDLYEKQDEFDPSTFETRASTILVGLGFKAHAGDAEGGSTIHKKTKDMSGGWRMRVALAKALFLAPAILLLDEPTNVSSKRVSQLRFSQQMIYLISVILSFLALGFGSMRLVGRLPFHLSQDFDCYQPFSRLSQRSLY